jgi:hypothetical protein
MPKAWRKAPKARGLSYLKQVLTNPNKSRLFRGKTVKYPLTSQSLQDA